MIHRPSTWFAWHVHLIQPGTRVLDLACGSGRHALAAAQAGARVTAIDRDADRLEVARREADRVQVEITWLEHDLERPLPVEGTFDCVLCFNYLDRKRLPQLLAPLGAGGFLIMETFLEAQRRLGWGPEGDDHLLQPGELCRLIAPLTVVYGREVLEPLQGERWQAVSSVVAKRRSVPDAR